MKYLRKPTFYLQCILILFSIVAFIFALIEGFKMNWALNSVGCQNFLALFNPYAILFSATFIVITANLAIERLGLMSDANKTSFLANTRTQWILIVREFLNELKEHDPAMKKEVFKQLIELHDFLFSREYKFSNKWETEEFFKTFFINKVQFFEEMSTKYVYVAAYKDSKQSYSWFAFRYIVVAMVSIDKCYKDFVSDIYAMYMNEVGKFNNDKIDPEAYTFGLTNYLNRNK